MNNNLPEIKREGIFTRIKNWFKGLFGIGEIVEEPVQEAIKEIDKEVGEIKKDTFKESLQVESKDKILALQRKLKEKQMEIADLTDEELDEMLELYKNQIKEKENKLRNYRNKIIKNKKGV